MSSALELGLGRGASFAKPGSRGGSLKGFCFSMSCKDAVERELVLRRRPLRWLGPTSRASWSWPWRCVATVCSAAVADRSRAGAVRPSFNLAARPLFRPNGHGMDARWPAWRGLGRWWWWMLSSSPAAKRDRAGARCKRAGVQACAGGGALIRSAYLVVSLHCRLECIMSDWQGTWRRGRQQRQRGLASVQASKCRPWVGDGQVIQQTAEEGRGGGDGAPWSC